MPGARRTSITRFAALCALVFGVLAMHHVTTTPLDPVPRHDTTHVSVSVQDSPAPADGTPAPDHGRDHAGFHLCLAVLLAAALALGVWLLLRTARTPRSRPRGPSDPAAGAGRAPPFAPTTSTMLSTLCILRV
ncbi:DUF6153 family protein [Prescottella subtropica]|uniref:DUF6153 family protein n=1 Tax=Prescottella subtropica TaxID=2545757 RepID=UPI0010F6C27A|nr:DUF6153 family protein [Prescottella subtropica]